MAGVFFEGYWFRGPFFQRPNEQLCQHQQHQKVVKSQAESFTPDRLKMVTKDTCSFSFCLDIEKCASHVSILDLRVACGKQAMCCRNHIAKMALPFWLKLGYLYLEKI